LILLVAPWSGFWDRNLFVNFLLGAAPSLEHIFSSPFTRGAVSGVGAITVIAGLAELAGVLALRNRPARTDTPGRDA
jgi:hypothetical protein